MLSRDTLELFSELLKTVTISPGQDDFEQLAARFLSAKRELAAALETEHPPPPVASPTDGING